MAKKKQPAPVAAEAPPLALRPPFRRLRAYALDPGAANELDTALPCRRRGKAA